MIKICKDDLVREIPELSERKSERYEILGEAEGADLHHCIYLGWKYGKKFFEQVVGYRKAPPTNAKIKIRVIFYARPGAKDWSPIGKAPRPGKGR